MSYKYLNSRKNSGISKMRMIYVSFLLSFLQELVIRSYSTMHIHNVIVIVMLRHFFTTIGTMYFLVNAFVAIFAVSFICIIQINDFVYLLFSSTRTTNVN